MTLLASRLYDPAVAVTKATTATLAMTPLDTTELRVNFTAPANGAVLVRIAAPVHGAATFPQILFGVMDGLTVVARVAPKYATPNLAATTIAVAEALFVVSGLTPGAELTWDAAYGVETLVASTAIKYGGPNDGTANNAFGAVIFEVWMT